MLLIYVRIVDLDGWLPHQPSNKPHNHGHGGAVHRYIGIGMAVTNQQALPLGASLEGIVQARSLWVLFILTA